MAKDARSSKRHRGMTKEDAIAASAAKTAAKLKKMRQAAELQIDKFMKKVGYTNPSERTDEEGWRWFNFGSAKGRVGIVESEADGKMYLRAESLVMELPSENDMITPLMRDLLEANMTIAGSARLAINGEGVFVCATIPVAELGADDVPAHIHSVMAIAESFSNPFDEEARGEEASQEGTPPEKVPDSGPQAA
jgi:hypothetical protein